jgi:putative holliday junction resolvase
LSNYLGIDYGEKRVGLAVADSDSKLASPLDTVAPHELVEAIKQRGPFDVVVVGLPRSLDGHDTPQTIAVRRFCDDVLWRKLRIDAVFQDEAGTSAIAEERLQEAGKPYTKADIDAEAATIILQDYLDAL